MPCTTEQWTQITNLCYKSNLARLSHAALYFRFEFWNDTINAVPSCASNDVPAVLVWIGVKNHRNLVTFHVIESEDCILCWFIGYRGIKYVVTCSTMSQLSVCTVYLPGIWIFLIAADMQQVNVAVMAFVTEKLYTTSILVSLWVRKELYFIHTHATLFVNLSGLPLLNVTFVILPGLSLPSYTLTFIILLGLSYPSHILTFIILSACLTWVP